MLNTRLGYALVASPWSRGVYAGLKCLCFCYLGLELALARGPVAMLGTLAAEAHAAIRAGANILTWSTAVFCLVRGLPVLAEGWRYFASSVQTTRSARPAQREAA